MSLRHRAGEVLRELVAEIVDDHVTGLAAEVAFFGVLSIFPGLLMIAAALGWLDVVLGSDIAGDAKDVVNDFLSRVLTQDASDTVDAVRELFERSSGGVLTVSIVAALWSLSRGFVAIVRALDLAYDVEERRSWIRQRITALFLALGSVVMTAFVLTIVVAGPLFGGGEAVADALGFGGVFATAWNWLRWPVAFAFLVIWATTLYHFAPIRRTAWMEDLAGAIAAALLWLVVSFGFGLYLEIVSGANQVLGVLGGGLILLVWLYLLSFALLVGGELNAILAALQGDIVEGDTER